MQPFVVNRHGRLVFPSNFQPDLDFSVIESEDQLDSVIRRDFETKAPKGTDIVNRIESGHYASRYELMRDVALNLFWVNRFAMTMYDKQPVRWRDVPRSREDVFLPIVAPWIDREAKVDAVDQAYRSLPVTWNEESEDRVWSGLFDAYGHRTFDATRLPSIKPTIAEALQEPESLTFTLAGYDPNHRFYSYEEIVDVTDEVSELEALRRWSMVLHNQYPWDRSEVRLTPVGGSSSVTFTLVPSVRHDLQCCDDLVSGVWSNVVVNIAGTGGTVTNIAVGPLTVPQRFYRLRLHF